MVICNTHPPPHTHTHTQRKTLYPQLNSIHTFIVHGLEDQSAHPPILLQKIKLNQEFFAKMPN